MIVPVLILPFVFSTLLDVYLTIPLYGFPNYFSLATISQKWVFGFMIELFVYNILLLVENPFIDTLELVSLLL